MWEEKGEPKPCGLKMAEGTPCVLDSGHDPEKSWDTREHKTADGTVFTWRSSRYGQPRRELPTLPFLDL